MTALRNSARGEDCTLRLPGCQNDRDTVVLCHIRRGWNCGTSKKPPDHHGFYGCHHCHMIQEGQVQVNLAPSIQDPAMARHVTKLLINDAVLDALLRTQDRMREKGL